jgi:sterol desaturase/sphingolipid hydroxylase (fatty acid hydroxylase superfamily)
MSTDRTARQLTPLVRRLIAIAILAGALAIDVSTALVIPVLFVIIVPFEKLFPRHRQRLRRDGLGTDIAFGLAQPLLTPIGGMVGAIVGFISLAWLPGLALRPLVLALPADLRVLAGVVLFDFVTYWLHRWSHEVGFLWRFHSVHHSTEKLDWVSGLRGHPLDGALLAPPFLFLIAAGFPFEVAGALAVVQVVTGLFLHANVRWRWRALHRVVITPEFHHWHHADEPAAHHTNYSVFLPIWDIVFGTYFMPKHRRPAVYGVTPRLPGGFVPLLRHPFDGVRAPRQMLRHPLVTLREGQRAVRRGVRQIRVASRRRGQAPAATVDHS